MKNNFSKSTIKIIWALFLCLGVAFSANVNAQTITTVGNTFVPDTVRCLVGDSIIFNLGATHNAVEVSQATYIANGTISNGGFSIAIAATDTFIPTLAQTYYYVCQPHVGMGMKGVIIAIDVTLTASPASGVGVSDGQINVVVNNGVGPYTYIWQNLSTGTGSVPFDDPNAVFSFPPLVAGTYVVTTIDNGAGVFSVDTTTITAPGGSFSYAGAMTLCGGPASTTDITAYLNGCAFAGPILGTQYILTDSTLGVVLLDTTLFVDSVVLPSLGPGTYYLSALNYDNGCTANDTFIVSTTTSLDSTIFSTNVINTTLGSASITVSGGTAPYSLCWEDPVVGPPCQPILLWNNGDTLLNLAAGTYLYTVLSADLPTPCSATGSIIIQNACSAQLSMDNTFFTICDTEIYLDAEMNMVDSGAYSFDYQLTDSMGTIIDFQTALTDSIRFINPVTSSGWYYLTATETTTGCSSIDSINVVINVITVTDTVIHCTVPAPACNGSINVTPTPVLGQFPYQFTWYDTSGAPIPGAISTALTSDLTGLCENIYCVEIEDANGCKDSLCYNVEFHPCDVNLLILDSIACYGSLGTIRATIDTSGLPAGPIPFNPGNRYAYQLFTTNPLTPFFVPVYTDSLFLDFINLPSNTYLVTVFDSSYGQYCNSDSLFLFQPDPIAIYVAATDSLGALHSIDSTSAPGIQDGIITIDSITGGTPGYNITWLDSNGLVLPTSGNLVQDSLGYSSDCNGGGYTIVVTDANGCGPVTEVVLVHAIVDMNIVSFSDSSITNPTCFNFCDGIISVHIDSVGIYNVPPFTFIWSGPNGFIDTTYSSWPDHSYAKHTDLCAGTYSLAVLDCYGRNFNNDYVFLPPLIHPDSMFVQLDQNDFLGILPCGEDSLLKANVFGGNRLTDTLLIRTETLNFGPSAIGFSDSLNAGKDYLLVVSGTYTNALGDTTFDAAFNYDLIADTALNDTMHWQINGATTHRPTPDVYQTSHIYNFPIAPSGLLTDSVFYEFQILPGTLIGSLTFELYEITFDTSIYTYSWTTDPLSLPAVISTTDTALAYPGLDTINYIVTVLDAKGCEAIDSVKVSWDLYILHFDTIITTNVICHGDPTGTISIAVDSSAGFLPYTWWHPGDSTFIPADSTASGLYVGDYVFHLQDSIGCLSLDTMFTLTEPDSVYACGIDTVLAHVLVDTWTMTFDAPYSYTTPTQDSLGYKLVVSGTYYDEWNTIPTVPTKDAAYQFLETTNLTPMTPPLAINEWQWNGSMARPMPDVYDPATHTYTYYDTALTANYVFTYTDPTGDYLNNGGSLFFELYKIVCSKTDTAYTCYGGATGTDTIMPKGGVPFIDSQGHPYYNIVWIDDASLDTVAIGATPSGLSAGDYTAIITDSTDCSYERYLVVKQSTDSLQLDTLWWDDVLCKGDSTGAIYAPISGGFGSQYVVLTQGIDTIYSVSGQLDTIHITGLPIGTYEIYIYDTIPNAQYGIWTFDCERKTSITITEPQDFLASTINILQHVPCFGDSTGIAESIVIGGQFPYTYAWDNGETTATAYSLWADSTAYSILSPSPLWQGITFTDANGCTLRDSVEIEHSHAEIQAFNTFDDQNGLPQTYTMQIVQDAQCFGVCDGIATLSTIGGVLPHIYEWDILQTSPNMPDTAFNLCAGGHDVIVEDDEGCRKTILFAITEPDELKVEASMISHVQCYGFDNGTALGSVLQGGTPPFTFAWDSINGQTGQIGDSLTPGIHTLWVTDGEGCIAYDTVLITEPDSLQVEIIDSLTIYSYCEGTNSAQLCAIATGGTPTYEYLWDDILGQTTPCATGLIAGQYIVTVRDDRNCIAFIDFDLDSITNTMIPTGVDMTIIDASCFGGYNGSVTINSVPSDFPPFSYYWNPGGLTTNTISSLYAQSYAVVIEDSLGCEVTVNALVGQPDELLYSTYNVIGETCFGACDGQIWVDVEGGTAPYYYDESQSNTFPIASANQVQLVNDSIIADLCADNSPYPNPYTIFITDANNCEAALSFGGTYVETIDSGVVVSIPVVAGTEDVSCYNSFDGEAWRIQFAGDSIFTYTWESSTPPFDEWGTGDSVSSLYAGDYVLVAHYSDSASSGQAYSGCDATSTVFTIGSPTPIIVVASVTDASCYGDATGEIDLTVSGGTSPYTYLWDVTTSIPGSTVADHNDLLAGTYTVTITDEQACDTTVAIIVEEPDAIISDFDVTPVSCFGVSDGEIEITIISGGTPTFQYSLNGGALQTSNIFTGLPAGIDTVVIEDGEGCTDSIFPIIITESASINVTAEVTSFFGTDATGDIKYNVSCNGSSNGTASTTAGGGKPPYTYSWSNGDITDFATNLSVGDYIVTIKDANLCEDSDTITIIEPDALVANGEQRGQFVSSGFDISCFGDNDGWIELNPSGGVTLNGYIYEYSWTGPFSGSSPNSPYIDNLIEGTYNVTITDANGCEYDTLHVLTQPLDIFVIDIATINYAGPVHGPASISFIDATTTLGNDDLEHHWYWGDFGDTAIFTNSAGMTFTHSFTELGENNVYALVINTNSGCTQDTSFIIEIQGIPDPLNNVFSPNNDGINDEFLFGEYAMENVEVYIYTRWGQEVYSWVGENKAWDGKGADGQDLPEAVYFFVFRAEGIDGHYYEEKGSVTLLR